MAKPFGGSGPPAALFHYSRDRGGTHPRGHPAGWSGILQADAYAGFNGLYAKGRAPAPLTEASCWAHGGARFFELADLAKAMRAPMAIEAVRRIDGNRRRPWSSPDAYGRDRIEHFKAQCLQPTERAGLVRLHHPAIADDIRGGDRGQASDETRFPHGRRTLRRRGQNIRGGALGESGCAQAPNVAWWLCRQRAMSSRVMNQTPPLACA